MVWGGNSAVRAARTLLTLLVGFGLAISAHTLGGGHIPGAVALVVLAVCIVPVAWWLTARRISAPQLFAFLIGAQAFVHAGLASMAPSGTGSLTAHHLHAVVPTTVTASGDRLASLAPSAGMLLWHLGATVVTATILARLDRVLWRAVLRLFRLRPQPAGMPVAVAVTPPLANAPRRSRTPGPLGGRAPPLLLS